MGTNILAANYFGDATHATAVTTLLQVVSTGYQTSTTISSLANPAAVGQTVTFVASVVSNSQNSGAPTGQFVFSEGNTTLATVPFTSGGPAVSGADFSIATLPAGTHIITVTYQPTGNFNGSSASVVEVIRGKASSISFMASPQSTLALAPVTLSAVVSASSVTPTGTVTFHDGGLRSARHPLPRMVLQVLRSLLRLAVICLQRATPVTPRSVRRHRSSLPR